MSKKEFVSDKRVTLKLMGLRYVSIRKYKASPGACLEYGYKGHDGSIAYDDEIECECMYKAIVAELNSWPLPQPKA